nr:DUF4397 domain-containing protein [Metabacillus kandeliae]
MYDMLASYYKYLDPNKHIMYYQMHLKAIQEAVKQQSSRYQMNSGMTNARFFHASPDAPAVDVYLNGKLVLRGLKYKEISEYMHLPAGQYRVDIYPTGSTSSPVIAENLLFVPGVAYTFTAAGPVSRIKLFPIVDKPFVAAGETKVKFVHLSPDAPSVDVAVKNGDVLFENISFMTSTKYITVPAGKYDLEVRLAGKDTVVLSVPRLQLRSDNAYTIFAVGLANGNPPLDAVVARG